MYDRGNGSSSQGGRYPGPPPFPPSTYANEHHPYHPQPSTSSSAYQQQSRPPPHAYPANAHAPPRDPGRPQSSTAQPTHAQPTSTSRTAPAHGAYHARSPSPGSDQSDEPQHKRVKREGRNDHRLRAQAQEDADADDDEGDSKSANGGKGAARSKQAGAAATAAANKKRAVQSCSECRRRSVGCSELELGANSPRARARARSRSDPPDSRADLDSSFSLGSASPADRKIKCDKQVRPLAIHLVRQPTR